MSGFNLPPGVTDSMIPGNRPEDVAWEKFIESDEPWDICAGCEDAASDFCMMLDCDQCDAQSECWIIEQQFRLGYDG